MKKLCRKLSLTVLAVTASMFLFSGCSEKKVERTADTSITVKVADTPIVIGVTLLQELQQQGYTIANDKKLEQTLLPDAKMPGRTYDVGVYFGKDGIPYGMVQCLNEKEEEIPYPESIINNITVYFSEETTPYTPPHYYESVLINDIDLKGLTAEEVIEKVKALTDEKPSETTYPDGSIAYLSFSGQNCYFSINFDMETHLIKQAEIEMFHSNF